LELRGRKEQKDGRTNIMRGFKIYALHQGISIGKPEVNRPLGKPKHRWEDNI
jgi:hypothetical protein